MHDPSLVEHIRFHTKTNMQHNGSFCAVFSIVFAELCALLLNSLCIIIVYDLTGRKERIVNEIHSSLGTGVFGRHLSTILSRRSCTEIALAT